MNISLPKIQEQFVRSQVSSGRYRTASEVVKDGLRLLAEAEHRRLLEKWIYEDLSTEELMLLPQETLEKIKAYFQSLVSGAQEEAKSGMLKDGRKTMMDIREALGTAHK